MRITFLPKNIIWDAEEGQTILKAAADAGVEIDGNCGGRGTCGKCRVRVSGNTGEEACDPHGILSGRDIRQGFRLACVQPVCEGMIVEVADVKGAAARKSKLVRLPDDFRPNAGVTKTCLTIEKTTLGVSESGAHLIRKQLEEPASFTIRALRKVPQAVAVSDQVTVTLADGRIIDVEPGDTTDANYGIAIDIGTTTLVVMLWDLNRAEMIDVEAVTNPQGAYGADVISRINCVIENRVNLHRLNEVLIGAIEKAVDAFCETGIRRENIYKYTVVGNTTMSHLFAEVDPSTLAVSPFAPVFTDGAEGSAAEFKLPGNPDARVILVPNIAGHVGADITAGIVTTDLMKADRGQVFIDIGTNGEIVACGNGKVCTCSTAAGPAFEGASIQYGMRAADGAIERVDLDEEGVHIGVIGDSKPTGICGSGIIDAVGELVRCKIVDKTGRLLDPDKLRRKKVPEALIERVVENDGVYDFLLYESEEDDIRLFLTQKDVREIQLAKAAMYAGVRILMKECGIENDTLDRVIIAGAFGSYIRGESAIHLGLLPDIDREKFYSAGNAAGIGASMVLLSDEVRRAAEEAAAGIEHIELAVRNDFQDEYMMAMRF